MFSYTKVFSSFSVNDLDKAKEFYGKKLGLTINDSMGLEIEVGKGQTAFAYPKPNHTPATFTILNFIVDDVKESVKDLKSKGVPFESYDDENIKTDADNIFHGGPAPMAWFTDPAGNILSLMQKK